MTKAQFDRLIKYCSNVEMYEEVCIVSIKKTEHELIFVVTDANKKQTWFTEHELMNHGEVDSEGCVYVNMGNGYEFTPLTLMRIF